MVETFAKETVEFVAKIESQYEYPQPTRAIPNYRGGNGCYMLVYRARPYSERKARV